MQTLREYLGEEFRGREKELERTISVIDPFREAMRRYSRFPLPMGNSLDEEEVLRVFRQVMGSSVVQRILFHSWRRPLPEGWEISENSLWDRLKANSWWRYAYEGLGNERSYYIGMGLQSRLGLGPWDRIGIFLFSFIMLTDVLGGEEEAKWLEDLIKLFPCCQPLGEKADEPGTWIMLTA